MKAIILAAVLFTTIVPARADEDAQSKAWVHGVKDEEFKPTPVAGTLDGRPISINSATYKHDDFGYRIRFQKSAAQAKPGIEIFLRTKEAILGKTLSLPLPKVATAYGQMPGSVVSKFTIYGNADCPESHSGRISFVPSKEGYLVGYVVLRASFNDMTKTWLNGYFYATPKR
jgi:hypothetical protein